jgi:exodeoxyribonuclease VII small subunit
MDKNQSFDASFAELQKISKQLDDKTITVDSLVQSVERAAELIAICEKKLTETENKIEIILNNLEKGLS